MLLDFENFKKVYFIQESFVRKDFLAFTIDFEDCFEINHCFLYFNFKIDLHSITITMAICPMHFLLKAIVIIRINQCLMANYLTQKYLVYFIDQVNQLNFVNFNFEIQVFIILLIPLKIEILFD